MEQMTFRDCVMGSWTSAREAIVQMSTLFAVCAAVLAVAAFFSMRHMPMDPAEAGPAMHMASRALTSVAMLVVQLVLYAVLSIKVHRFVLLEERAQPVIPLNGKPLLRYVAVAVGMGLAIILAALLLTLVLRPQHVGGALFLLIVLYLAWIYAMVRLSLVFPAIALGGPIALRGAWHDTRRHFWSMSGVTGVAALPLIVIGSVLIVLLSGALSTPEVTWLRPVSAIVQGALNAFFVVLTASSLSWLYRRYANELLPPGARDEGSPR
jgi:hypothetical protein